MTRDEIIDAVAASQERERRCVACGSTDGVARVWLRDGSAPLCWPCTMIASGKDDSASPRQEF